MKISASLAVLCCAALSPTGSAHGEGSANAAWRNWALQCQGCHRADGSGSPGGALPMRGVVGRFLWTAEGRDYLTRVPGVATVPLSDAQLADVLTYAVTTFDGANLPSNFTPFTPSEIAEGRRRLLRTDAVAVRRSVIGRLPLKSGEGR